MDAEDVSSFLTEVDIGSMRFKPRLTIPSQHRGWIILAHSPALAPLDQAQSVLWDAGWATLWADWQNSNQLRIVSEWLATQTTEQGKPIGLWGADCAADTVLRAAAHNPHVNTIVTWNGRAGCPPRDVTAPTLLLLSADADWRVRLFSRLAQQRLTAYNERVIVPDLSSPVIAQVVAWLAAEHRQPMRRTNWKLAQRMATSVAIAALALPLTLHAVNAPPVLATPVEKQIQAYDPFDEGVVIHSSQVRGDTAEAQPSGKEQTKKPKKQHARQGEQVIGANQVKGDGLGPQRPTTTGAHQLVDGSGLKYFINDNITFNTSSSASAAMSEASFTHAGPATTANGGTVATTLNDAFDGYNTLCFSLNGAATSCSTTNANQTIYNKNGAAAPDTQCTGVISPALTRQYVFNTQLVTDTLEVSRKVYVPDDDSFARWLNTFHNVSTQTLTVTAMIANNLGSDSNTRITNSSLGQAVTPTLTNTLVSWVTTFQNYSGITTTTTTTDPRLGHVLQGPNAPTPLSVVNFTDGSDRPYWGYTLNLQPGETKIIMNFVTGQLSKAAAAQQAARLTTLPTSTLRCMTGTEIGQIANFAMYGLSLSPTAAAKQDYVGKTVAYVLTLTNTSNIPSVFNLSAAGNAWQVTLPVSLTLAEGASQPFTAQVTIPLTATHLATDTVTITAALQASPEVTATAKLLTTAQKYRVYLPLILR